MRTQFGAAIGMALLIGAAPVQGQELGLDNLMGVKIGMPLAEAANILRLRGFLPATELTSRKIAQEPEEGAEYLHGIAGWPRLGLATTKALIPSDWGLREVKAFSSVYLTREQDGVTIDVQIDAEHLAAADGLPMSYGRGRVFAVEVFQSYSGVEAPVGWLQIEARLRDAARLSPTCESFGDEVSLVWQIQMGEVVAPGEAYDVCSAAAFGAVEASSPEAVITDLLVPAEEPVEEAPLLGSLVVQIAPSARDGWIWMQRVDPALRRDVLEEAVTQALRTPPVPVSIVDF